MAPSSARTKQRILVSPLISQLSDCPRSKMKYRIEEHFDSEIAVVSFADVRILIVQIPEFDCSTRIPTILESSMIAGVVFHSCRLLSSPDCDTENISYECADSKFDYHTILSTTSVSCRIPLPFIKWVTSIGRVSTLIRCSICKRAICSVPARRLFVQPCLMYVRSI